MALKKKVAVVGAGITGLSIAYRLQKNGDDVTVFEAANHVGGKIGTIYSEGLEFHLGPVSMSETPKLRALISELNLEIIPATNATRKRYIYSQGKLHNVGVTSALLSAGGKFSMLKAMFGSKATPQETVKCYATRRFGEEAYQKLFNPIMNGVYAGNAELLSATSVFKKRGRRKIISLKGGVAALTSAMAMKLGSAIKTSFSINHIDKLRDFDEIHLATPSFVTAGLIRSLNPDLADKMSRIKYSNVTQIYLETVPGDHPFDGFGFLIPSDEKMSLLGAICVSNAFPEKVPEGRRQFVLFAGGDRPYSFSPSVDDAVKEFQKIVDPSLMKVLHVQEWRNAIPQPYVGHEKIIESVRKFEQENPRIRISGNYLSGVAVGDCVV